MSLEYRDCPIINITELRQKLAQYCYGMKKSPTYR